MLITPPLFMEVPVPIIQESERLYIWFQVSVLLFFSDFRFDFGIVPTVRYS